MAESDLSNPVSELWKSKGYVVYAEVRLEYGAIDLVALRATTIVAVELKLSLSWKVIKQAALNQIVADVSYVAIGTVPRKSGLDHCGKLGIGVIVVCGGIASIHKSPGTHHARCINSIRHQRMLRELSHSVPGGVGGTPTLRGIGPAQGCYDKIEAYRREHPEATWRQTYESVPNHYCSVLSIRGAMRVVSERRQRREASNG